MSRPRLLSAEYGLAIALRCLPALLLLALPGAAHGEWLHQDAAIMGTRITVELWHEDARQGRALIETVLDEMRRIDGTMSSWKAGSELSRINENAAHGPVAVSGELFSLIQHALRFSELTRGAFDITYASTGHYYDFRSGKRPDTEQLASSTPLIDYRLVRLDAGTSTIEFLRPGVRIDLGGIAKGYAVDRSIALLQEAGVENALVSAGGDTRVLGRHQDRAWNIGIRDPRKQDGIVSTIPLENTAISTSGDYERYFESDGVRYHHILDPGTGDSARAVHSTSIISTRATDTDALSTSVFVMGVDSGLELINRLPDTEAIIVDDQGLLHFSDGIATASR